MNSPRHSFRARIAGRVENFASGGSDEDSGITHVDFDAAEPNVVTSQARWPFYASPYHLPVIDLDIDAHLEPSSTPGHHHLYLEKPMSKDDYLKLLKVMAEVGLVEWGYYEATVKRGYSTVRLPWVFKEEINDLPAELLPGHIKRLLG